MTARSPRRRSPNEEATSRPRQAPFSAPLVLLRSLWRVNHALERLSSRMSRAIGMTAQQRFLLRVVEERPRIAAADLASVLHLDPATVSVSLQRLRAKRLIARHPDPDDARRSTLRLTASGRSRIRPGSHTAEHAVAQALESLSERERAAAARLLEVLASTLESRLDKAPNAGRAARSAGGGTSRARREPRRGARKRDQSFKVTKRVPPA